MALNLLEVDAGKRYFEENGWKVTVRALSKHLGRDINAVSEGLRLLNEAEKARSESKIQINPMIENLRVLEIEEAVAKATQESELRAKAAEDTLNVLAAHVREFDALFLTHSENWLRRRLRCSSAKCNCRSAFVRRRICRSLSLRQTQAPLRKSPKYVRRWSHCVWSLPALSNL